MVLTTLHALIIAYIFGIGLIAIEAVPAPSDLTPRKLAISKTAPTVIDSLPLTVKAPLTKCVGKANLLRRRGLTARSDDATVLDNLMAVEHSVFYTIGLMMGGGGYDLLLDTGSSALWLAASDGKYSDYDDGTDPVLFSDLEGHKSLYTPPPGQTTTMNATIVYGQGNIAGRVVSDEMGIIGLQTTAPGFNFVAATAVNAFPGVPTVESGIFPLMANPHQWTSGAGNFGDSPVAALFNAGLIGSTVVGISLSYDNAAVTFGGVDTSGPDRRGVGFRFYNFTLGDIAFGATTLLRASSDSQTQIYGFTDTGTTAVYVPTTSHSLLMQGIPGASQWRDVCTSEADCDYKAMDTLTGGFVLPCTPKDNSQHLVFTIAGAKFPLAYTTLLVDVSSDSWALFGVAVASPPEGWCLPSFWPSDGNQWLLGVPFLRNVYQAIDPIAMTLELTSLVDASVIDTSTW